MIIKAIRKHSREPYILVIEFEDGQVMPCDVHSEQIGKGIHLFWPLLGQDIGDIKNKHWIRNSRDIMHECLLSAVNERGLYLDTYWYEAFGFRNLAQIADKYHAYSVVS